jgi:hypothetical protein
VPTMDEEPTEDEELMNFVFTMEEELMEDRIVPTTEEELDVTEEAILPAASLAVRLSLTRRLRMRSRCVSL